VLFRQVTCETIPIYCHRFERAGRVIDEKDAIFSSLRLWIDSNHDGVAQTEQIHSLPELGVFSISLHYRESRKEDQYGNLFRYWSRINLIDPDEDDSRAGRVAYDVFFTTVANQ
jgi:hypothetical protein